MFTSRVFLTQRQVHVHVCCLYSLFISPTDLQSYTSVILPSTSTHMGSRQKWVSVDDIAFRSMSHDRVTIEMGVAR